jgi:transcriptional regulator with XRE-family HTH domain
MKEPDIKTVAGRVQWVFHQERALDKKFTQRAFAKAIGVSPQAVGQWFNRSTKTPAAENLYTISQKFPYNLRWLMTGDGPRHREPAAAQVPRGEERPPLTLYSIEPDDQARLLALFEQLSPPQRAKVMQDLEATVTSNLEVARHLGRLPHHPADEHVANHIKPAPKHQRPHDGPTPHPPMRAKRAEE